MFFWNFIKYRRYNLRLAFRDLRQSREIKVLEKGFSLYMLIRFYLALRKKKMGIVGIAAEGKLVDYNILLDHPMITLAKRTGEILSENGIMVQCGGKRKIDKIDYLRFKNVLKEIKADDK